MLFCNMEELAILDYNTSEVHFYRIDNDTEVDESYIDLLGHNPNACSWMVSEFINIIKHK